MSPFLYGIVQRNTNSRIYQTLEKREEAAQPTSTAPMTSYAAADSYKNQNPTNFPLVEDQTYDASMGGSMSNAST